MMRSLQNRFLLATWGVLFGTSIVHLQLCPSEVSNGIVTTSCSRQPKEECKFTCNSGFTPAVGVTSITCGSNGNWTFTSAVCLVQCPSTVNRGAVTSCTRLPGSVCNFSCDAGFRAVSNVTSIVCGKDGQWSRVDVCIGVKATCPLQFTGGSFIDCANIENETCQYYCYDSFRQNTQILNATCRSNGAWNQNTQNLCTRMCGMSIPNGFLNSLCTFNKHEVCSFKCKSGSQAKAGVSTVTCQENGEWAPAEPCIEVLCPITIRNGTVDANMCDRRVYSECPFTCNQGFDPNPRAGKLFCGINGNWIESVSPACLERQGICINYFDNGKWANGCGFRPMETCAFKCNSGFQKNPNITGNITCTVSAEWNMDLKLLCKSYDRGLIITVMSADSAYIETVPTTKDGAPNVDSITTLDIAAVMWLLSVDGDYALRQAYVYDYYSSTIYRDSNFSIGLSRENKWTPIHRGLSKDYVKLAVDWINHNIYWTDPQYKWIAVQSLVGKDTSMFRVLIDDNLEAPHALALDPLEALLFWSDIGSFTKIEISSLSGRNRKSLISSNLIEPYGLAADYGTRRIYWIDSGRYTMESITYEGKERKILLKQSDSSFFDLAVYQDYLYVTDSSYKQVHFLNKTNGNMLETSLSRTKETYLGVTVFHPDSQQTSAAVSCVNNGCDHMCVTEKGGVSCVCRDGYILNQDMKTCSVNNEYFHRGLVFSNDSSICIVDIRVLTHFSYVPKCVLNINGTRYMVMDTDQRQIIIANDTSIYWASVDNLELHELTKPFGTISGLAWDGYDRNVYWSENNTGNIWRVSRESDTAIVVLSGLISPRDIVILPNERMLYWISERNGSTIECCSLDGSNHQGLLNNENLMKPRSLSYDVYAKRIYFLDIAPNGFNSVYSCNIDGSDLTYFLSIFKRLDNLALYKGHLLLTSTSRTGTLLMSYSIDHGSNTTSGVFPLAGNITAVKFFDENFRQNETGPCYNFNGGCEQICLSSGKSRICECTFGFKLAPNGKNCLTDPIKDNFMLIEDGTHNNIYQISLTDQSIRGIKGKVTESLTGIIYNPVYDLVIWVTEESEISMIHLNGTGQQTFITLEENNFYPNQFAVDISTGNIYYSAVSYMESANKYQSHIGVILPNGKHKAILTRLSYPQGLVVYPSKGLMFYIDSGYETYIGQANMDGTQASVLLELSNDRFPTELTIDYKNDYLYWFDYADTSICYCKLDGTNYETLVKYPDANINGLALYKDYLYITSEEHSSMQKVKISNPNENTEFASYGELGSIGSITIYSSTVQNKNAFCSVGNGGCSTFCFPTPRGGLCACEDGVHLKDGSDTLCSNIPQCPVKMGKIIVSTDCQRVNGSECNFTCEQGYTARQYVKNVLCNGVTYTPEDSCEVQCPATVSRGAVTSCTRLPGSVCNFSCDDGFRAVSNVTSIVCGKDGQWSRVDVCIAVKTTCPLQFTGGSFIDCSNIENETCQYYCYDSFRQNTQILNATCRSNGAWTQNTQNLCTRMCGMSIPNGYLNSLCTFNNHEVCSFTCKRGYQAKAGVSTVTCQENGEWALAEPCIEVLCPITIRNGTVDANMCDRRVYSECPFTCNQGFDPNPRAGKLFCGINGNWIESVSPACLERQALCINYFDNGKWANGCGFRSMETCAFKCNSGFQKNPNITGNITCTVSAEWNMDLKLLCKSYDRGLIITVMLGYTADSAYIETVPTTTDGAPNVDSISTIGIATDIAADMWFLSVDGDYALRQAYVYDYYSSTIYRDCDFSIGMTSDNKWTPLHRGLSKDYVKLAVDWINHNIYWTDPQYKWIAVKSLVGKDTSMFRVLIDDNLEAPHALALDPLEALLFWSDIGSFTKIEISSLSGRNRKSLISSNLIAPYGLAADYGTRRIYWIDSGRYTLESITYEGKERKILLKQSDSSFFDLAVYQDYLYVTDSSYNHVHFLNKTNGNMLETSLSRREETFLAVTVFHPDSQQTSAPVSCVNNGCDHMCVTEKGGVSCVCSDGYILNQDMKTCSVNNEYFHRGLVFSNDSSICIVDIRVLTHFSYVPKCVLNINGTRYMVMDTDQRQIIIANDTSIYWTMVDNLELHELTKPSGTISGLAWDGYDRNVYWSENDTGNIWRVSRESDTAIVVLSGLISPRDILILPNERMLYWISERNGSTIECCNLDGSNHQGLLNNENLMKPRCLSYDVYAKRIYFLDIALNGVNRVYSCNIDGSDLTYFLSIFKRLDKLAIYKGHLLLTSTSRTGTLLMSYSIDLGSNTTSGVFPGAGNITAVKFFDENFQQNETGPCYNFNGECEQICLSSGKSRICECTFGFKLAPNGKNCLTDPIKDNFMLIEDGTHNNIYQISLIDQSIRGIKAKVTESLTGIIYNPVYDLVIWGTEESEISMIHLNGTGHQTFITLDENNFYPNQFAVDISTGNMYFSAVSYMESANKYQSHIGVILPNGKHKVILTRLSYPQGLVVYPSKGLMFYIDRGYETYIGRANMDGTQASVLLELSNDRFPTELTIDYKNDYLYWFDYADRSICYCKLDGTNYETLVKYPDANINGLALYKDYLYITSEEHLSTRKVKISNPNEDTEFASYGELGSIGSITIYSSMEQNKNAFCSEGNGGCSTFCFPTSFGGICACEDGVHLQDGSDTVCSNIPQCPVKIGKIIVSTDCQRVNGSECNFTCEQGYTARQDVKNVLCNGVTYTPEDSCEASPSILVASKSEVNQAALGSGVGIGVTIVIVIIVVSVFFTLRRRKLKSAYTPKRMQEDVMTATFGPDNEFALDSYDNCAVHIINAKKTEEPQNLKQHSINTGRDASKVYDESMAIPRPHAI